MTFIKKSHLKPIANRINDYRNGQDSRFYHNQWY